MRNYIIIKDLSLYVNNNADYGIYAPKLTASEIDSITIFGASNYALRIEYGWSNISDKSLILINW